jgi:hypothetical protein
MMTNPEELRRLREIEDGEIADLKQRLSVIPGTKMTEDVERRIRIGIRYRLMVELRIQRANCSGDIETDSWRREQRKFNGAGR